MHKPPTKPGTSSPPATPGLLTTCGTGWCVAGDRARLRRDGRPDPDAGRLQRRRPLSSVQDELTSLVGQSFTVTEVDDPTTVVKPGTTTSPATAVAAPLESIPTKAASRANAKKDDPVVFAITVDQDGLVTSINGLPYLVTPA